MRESSTAHRLGVVTACPPPGRHGRTGQTSHEHARPALHRRHRVPGATASGPGARTGRLCKTRVALRGERYLRGPSPRCAQAGQRRYSSDPGSGRATPSGAHRPPHPGRGQATGETVEGVDVEPQCPRPRLGARHGVPRGRRPRRRSARGRAQPSRSAGTPAPTPRARCRALPPCSSAMARGPVMSRHSRRHLILHRGDGVRVCREVVDLPPSVVVPHQRRARKQPPQRRAHAPTDDVGTRRSGGCARRTTGGASTCWYSPGLRAGRGFSAAPSPSICRTRSRVTLIASPTRSRVVTFELRSATSRAQAGQLPHLQAGESSA